MIAGQPWAREDLPDTVTTNKTEFMDGLIKDGHTAIVDSTSGTAMYLFLEMHRENDHPVRVIFDTGASISLWLAAAVKDGCLRAYLDVANPTTITRVGKGQTQAQTATVIIPGNIQCPDGGYPVYLSKSTIANEIIALYK